MHRVASFPDPVYGPGVAGIWTQNDIAGPLDDAPNTDSGHLLSSPASFTGHQDLARRIGAP